MTRAPCLDDWSELVHALICTTPADGLQVPINLALASIHQYRRRLISNEGTPHANSSGMMYCSSVRLTRMASESNSSTLHKKQILSNKGNAQSICLATSVYLKIW